MTEKKLNAITEYLKENVWRNHNMMFAMNTDDVSDIDESFWKLIDIVTSLHNELYKEVKGDYYNYSFHWTNKIGACEPDDGIFKDMEDNENAS
jgi:hypothetical protein